MMESISGVLGVLEHRFNPWPGTWLIVKNPVLQQLQLRLQLWLQYGSYVRIPYAVGQPKMEKKKKRKFCHVISWINLLMLNKNKPDTEG